MIVIPLTDHCSYASESDISMVKQWHVINHTELSIEMCLTAWNCCIRVHDGTRVVFLQSYVIRVVNAQELCENDADFK